MSLFIPEYAEQMNVPICTGVIDLTLDSGEVVILDIGQGLRFGNRMEKSLINPNSIITASPESSVKSVTPVHRGTFICYAYSGRNGYTVHSSEVNDIGIKLAPKQWISS